MSDTGEAGDEVREQLGRARELGITGSAVLPVRGGVRRLGRAAGGDLPRRARGGRRAHRQACRAAGALTLRRRRSGSPASGRPAPSGIALSAGGTAAPSAGTAWSAAGMASWPLRW
ncbi:hypothetical protein [Nonomuraea dietziae]|uniref:hypothetical protein n=1 Tax=Nonomuraea dietziae TaxID=65515 RepID=UPI0031D89626